MNIAMNGFLITFFSNASRNDIFSYIGLSFIYYGAENILHVTSPNSLISTVLSSPKKYSISI